MKAAVIAILVIMILTLAGCELQQSCFGQCSNIDKDQMDATPVSTNINNVFGEDSTVTPPYVNS